MRKKRLAARVPATLDQHIEHVAVLVYGPPEIMQFASDADEHFIQKPFVPGLRPPPLERPGIGAPEAQAPFTDGLEADHDASCREDQFDFPHAQTEAVVQPDSLIDDLGRIAEAPIGIGWRAHAQNRATDRRLSPT